MKTELILKFSFTASHSLIGNEIPHSHLWGLEVALTGIPRDGKIIDIIEARGLISEQYKPLVDTYLNTNKNLDAGAQKAPTCETLANFFWDSISTLVKNRFSLNNSTIQLSSIAICIFDPGNDDLGQVRISAC